MSTTAIPEPEHSELDEIVERLVARVLETGKSIADIVGRYLPQGRRHWTEQTVRELTQIGLRRLVTAGLHDHNAGRGVGIECQSGNEDRCETASPPRIVQPGAPHPKELPPVLRTMADIQLATIDGSRVTVDRGTMEDFTYWAQRFSAQKEGLAAREHACTTAKRALRTHRVSCPRNLPRKVRLTLDTKFSNAWHKGVGA